MKIRMTESVGDVFNTVEVENPTEEVVHFLLGNGKEIHKNLDKGFSKKVDVEEPKSLLFDPSKFGSSLSVECNYNSYKWAKKKGFKEVIYLKISNINNTETTTLSIDEAKTLHKYLSEVIEFMEG